MKGNNRDTLARAHAKLVALRNNIADMHSVNETYVTEYHASLDLLEGIGIDVSDFRISSSEIQPLLTSWNIYDGSKTYSSAKFVPKALILTKLDSVLIYLQDTGSQKPRTIGFQTPEKQ